MINSRTDLGIYALRKLGAPVTEINVDDEQIQDRIDDALQIMQERHLSGSQRLFVKHQITPSTLIITTNTATDFLGKTIVTGQTSGATASIITFNTKDNNLSIKGIKGTFLAGETIVAGSTTAVLAATNFLILGDTENQYIQLPDSVLSVLRVLPMTNTSGNGSTNPFDLTYQLRMNDLYNLSSTSMVYYTQTMQHLQLINMTLVGEKPIRFNQHMHKLFIDMDWQNYIAVGEYIVVECYAVVSPEDYTNLYNNQWLKAYTTALIKQQWGANMQKFEGVKLPGGVTLNGKLIYEQAGEEINDLMLQLQDVWTDRMSFFVG